MEEGEGEGEGWEEKVERIIKGFSSCCSWNWCGWDAAQLLQEGAWLPQGVPPRQQRGKLLPWLHTWAQGLHEGVIPGAEAGPGRHRGEWLADETP